MNQLMARVEINANFSCNLACKGCNRLCNLTQLDKPMSVEQIALFVKKLGEEGKRVSRIKLVGGEPTLHPQFMEICEVLSSGVQQELIGKVVVNTNGVTQNQFVGKTLPTGVFWKCSPPRRKQHRPFLWSPKDLGLASHGPCKMPKVCGYSLDVRGWLPCSAAIAIARLFNLEHLYKPLDGPLPTKIWGMDELCQDCIHGVPDFFGRKLIGWGL